MRFASFAIAGLLGGSLIAACSSSTPTSPPGADADASTPVVTDEGGATDGGADVAQGFPDDRGPGVFGALPSGYCCTKDTECKGRQCVDVAGGERMCLDPCSVASNCDVPKTPFDCTLPAGQQDGQRRCTPPVGVRCVPAVDFVRGKLVTGDCCAVAPGQAAGRECGSHICGSFGDGPYICTNRCLVQADCPSGYKCEPDIATCLPLAVLSGGTYTCK